MNNNEQISNTSSVESELKTKLPRKSGVELLKIFAIFLIVLCHVLNTLDGSSGAEILLGDWVIQYTTPGTGFTNLVLSILRYSGQLGNVIFVVCSSWFLLDKEASNKKKLLQIFFDVFTISIIYLVFLGFYLGFKTFSIKEIIKSIFPNYFANNWFITYYFVFALLSPIFNKIIKSFDKQIHFIISLILFILFFIIGFIYDPDFTNKLIVWISIYFIISYFKIYGKNFCANKKLNIALVLVGIFDIIAITSVTYLLGSKLSFLNSMIRWSKQNSPFALCIAFGSLNLVNRTKFTSKFINNISSLSFLIYIIHENILFRTYIRPQIWNHIYTNFGYNLLFLWIILFTTGLFIFSTLISELYKISLQKTVHYLSNKIYKVLSRLINWCQTKLIRIIK